MSRVKTEVGFPKKKEKDIYFQAKKKLYTGCFIFKLLYNFFHMRRLSDSLKSTP